MSSKRPRMKINEMYVLLLLRVNFLSRNGRGAHLSRLARTSNICVADTDAWYANLCCICSLVVLARHRQQHTSPTTSLRELRSRSIRARELIQRYVLQRAQTSCVIDTRMHSKHPRVKTMQVYVLLRAQTCYHAMVEMRI